MLGAGLTLIGFGSLNQRTRCHACRQLCYCVLDNFHQQQQQHQGQNHEWWSSHSSVSSVMLTAGPFWPLARGPLYNNIVRITQPGWIVSSDIKHTLDVNWLWLWNNSIVWDDICNSNVAGNSKWMSERMDGRLIYTLHCDSGGLERSRESVAKWWNKKVEYVTCFCTELQLEDERRPIMLVTSGIVPGREKKKRKRASRDEAKRSPASFRFTQQQITRVISQHSIYF
jgi:hypothetical protein